MGGKGWVREGGCSGWEMGGDGEMLRTGERERERNRERAQRLIALGRYMYLDG